MYIFWAKQKPLSWKHDGIKCVGVGILSSEGSESEPAGGLARAGESSSVPVLRRLRQNREKRNSRLRASALIISQAD